MADNSKENSKPKSLYQVSVLHRASSGKTTVVVEPKTVLATTQEVARLTVIREVGEEYSEKLDELDVLVRPF